MKKKTKLEIIEETAAAYNSSTRAYEDGDCRYKTKDGRQCAVGRCMTKAALANYGRLFGSANQLAAESGEEGFQTLLKPSYRGNDVSFWMDIQGLHDRSAFWDTNGITGIGNLAVKGLKKKYKTAPPVKNYEDNC